LLPASLVPPGVEARAGSGAVGGGAREIGGEGRGGCLIRELPLPRGS